MISPTLVKLIDQSIIPGFILVFSKFLGVIIVAKIISASWKVATGTFFLPTFSFSNYQDYLTINSFSNLVMFLAIAAGTAFVLVRAHFFHASHISPSIHLKLLKFGLEGLIAETYQLYHQAAVWLLFLWLATILILLQAFFGLSNPVIAITSFLISLNFSWFLISDIEQEVEIFRKQKRLSK